MNYLQKLLLIFLHKEQIPLQPEKYHFVPDVHQKAIFSQMPTTATFSLTVQWTPGTSFKESIKIRVPVSCPCRFCKIVDIFFWLIVYFIFFGMGGSGITGYRLTCLLKIFPYFFELQRFLIFSSPTQLFPIQMHYPSKFAIDNT